MALAQFENVDLFSIQSVKILLIWQRSMWNNLKLLQNVNTAWNSQLMSYRALRCTWSTWNKVKLLQSVDRAWKFQQGVKCSWSSRGKFKLPKSIDTFWQFRLMSYRAPTNMFCKCKHSLSPLYTAWCWVKALYIRTKASMPSFLTNKSGESTQLFLSSVGRYFSYR